ncbi:MAG: hypothetical protein GEV28_25250 [Actinophytocola sp.]|uniref:hypothetical protein n=1 Tax=Actinophytocola sp. TaxID=1872138 RepID=UPI001322D66B|nr:hypothetical protein [Actinophytocola sp.]MPZ83519.1 hypothetical protein [Actinophytocola sp.]
MQLGAYGLATSLAAVLGPPISLWLASTHRDTVLYGGVFVAAAGVMFVRWGLRHQGDRVRP